jgi:hypothetical protein
MLLKGIGINTRLTLSIATTAPTRRLPLGCRHRYHVASLNRRQVRRESGQTLSGIAEGSASDASVAIAVDFAAAPGPDVRWPANDSLFPGIRCIQLRVAIPSHGRLRTARAVSHSFGKSFKVDRSVSPSSADASLRPPRRQFGNLQSRGRTAGELGLLRHVAVPTNPSVRTHRITNSLDCDPSSHRRLQRVAPTQRLLGPFP